MHPSYPEYPLTNSLGAVGCPPEDTSVNSSLTVPSTFGRRSFHCLFGWLPSVRALPSSVVASSAAPSVVASVWSSSAAPSVVSGSWGRRRPHTSEVVPPSPGTAPRMPCRSNPRPHCCGPCFSLNRNKVWSKSWLLSRNKISKLTK